MVVRLPVSFALLDPAITGRDVSFHPDERADSGFMGFFLKLPCSVHVAMIGDGERGHLELESPLDQVIDSICAVEKRVFRVAV